MFNGLPNIKTINLTLNLIMHVSSGTFKDVAPYSVHSYNVQVCCMSGSWHKCKVKEDALSKCDNLVSSKYLRYLCWLIAILAFVLNIISFLLHNKPFTLHKNTFPTGYLALVDWCFGIYLLIIASADLYYKANYIGYELIWKGHFICKAAAFFALTSMMVSPMILCLMMVARYCVVHWPMTSKYKSKDYVKRLVEVFLIVGLYLCIIFISGVFGILGKNMPTGICLPVYISEDKALFILLISLVVFLVQICCLFLILILSFLLLTALKRMEHVTDLQNRNTKSVKTLVKHLSLVIVTNMCCWIPSDIVLILALAGYHVSNQLLRWVILIVIPINSVLDPLLFTIFTPEMRQALTNLWNESNKKIILF